jgi:hypothetical protein
MYKENKYTTWYYSIINRAQLRQLSISEYREKHHIIPKSLGGNNSKDNLVSLTAREHFICHLLLPKMVDSTYKSKMLYALWGMTNLTNLNQQNKRYKPPARIYEKIRRIISIQNSGASHSKAKIYEVTEPNGTKHTVNYLKQFCKDKNFNYDQVLRLVREHRPGQGGDLHMWTFVDINSDKYQKPFNKPKVYGNRKTYHLISPEGKQFTVVGGLEKFCIENNLILCTMQTIAKTGIPAKHGKCVGWTITN